MEEEKEERRCVYHSFSLYVTIYRGSGVLCVIRFGFVADRYAGVIRLQDALLKEKLLYRMPVQARYLTTSDGKRKFLLLLFDAIQGFSLLDVVRDSWGHN